MLDFAISCDDEGERILSNWRELRTWETLQQLITILVPTSSNQSILYAWKQGHHQSTAKEPYAWRSALDDIKNSDLPNLCAGVVKEDEDLLIMDKPTMLKIAGEIINSLMHSYESRHKISFIQKVSKVPS